MARRSIAPLARRDSKAPEREIGSSPLWHLRAAELLRERGLVTSGALAGAIADQVKWQSTLGEVLIGKGLVRPLDYYRAFAEVHGVPFVDLLAEPPDEGLITTDDRDLYARLQVMPWRLEDGSMVLAAVEIGDAQRTFAEARYGATGHSFVITSPFDILWQTQKLSATGTASSAREALLLVEARAFGQVTVTPTAEDHAVGLALLCAGCWSSRRCRRLSRR